MPAFQTHMVRFFIPDPKAIHCAAINHRSKKLALSRSDNSIELWDARLALSCNGPPVWQTRLPAVAGFSVEALAWCGERLFSAGLHGHVLEHSTDHLAATASAAVSGAAVWCLAAPSSAQLLAAGTEDGQVVIHQLGDQGLLLQKRLTKQERRILCVSWHPEGRYLAAGSINSVCLHDTDTGAVMSRITVGRKPGVRETLVWSVALLPDLTVVAGDSSGRVSFWDGRLGALHSSLGSHRADVLTVAAVDSGDTVFAAGVDPAIVRFDRVTTKRSGADNWVRSTRMELHVRDVRVLLAADRWLISAGVDAALVFDLVGSNKETIRTSPLPQLECVLPAPSLPGLVTVSDGGLQLWRLPDTASSEPPTLLLELRCKPGEPVVCAAVSAGATWLAYSTPSRLRLHRVDVTLRRPSLQRVRSVAGAADTAARRLRFSPAGGALLMLTADGRLVLLQLTDEHHQMTADDLGPAVGAAGDDGEEQDTAMCAAPLDLLTISGDGSRAALADRSGALVVWDLTHRTILCKLARHTTAATALTFRPGGHHLVAVYADRTIAEFDTDAGRLTPWSRWVALSSSVPAGWRCRPLSVRHVSFTGCGSRILLHDDTGLCAIDAAGHVKPAAGKKRARAASTRTITGVDEWTAADAGVVITDKYRHLLYLASFGDEHLLAVEAPPARVEEKLPPPLKRKYFGVA